ncbi:alanine racemase [Desulfocurvibacter africanus]|uniref:alanine racemase n=1 Tax=Desulfocurvibacter africanus TaxID=873 RepID=UPI002FD9FD15
MAITYNMLEVQVDLKRIVDNYRFMRSRAARLMPVIKADAYGHGLLPVAKALAAAGADAFCVGSVGEAVTLRRERKPDSGCRVVSLLGPMDREDYAEAVSHEVTLLVGRHEQLELLQVAASSAGRMAPVALKFDTGMSRLGFSEADVPRLIQTLATSPNLRLELVTSHLATADEDSGADYVLAQAERFRAITAKLSAAGLRFQANLANSAGILAYPELHFDLQRPGIALYGSNPFLGTNREELGRPLKQAMSVTTRILDVHDLPRGGTISYGRTYTAPRDMRVAIMAAGYADGYSRGLSNKGQVCLKGSRAPILGRVCMQLTAVDITGREDVHPGDTVHLLGGSGRGYISVEELAGWWGTISYESFCILGLNRRVYFGGD